MDKAMALTKSEQDNPGKRNPQHDAEGALRRQHGAVGARLYRFRLDINNNYHNDN